MGLLIASGMIKGILTLLVTINVLTDQSGAYQLWYSGADALMYFFPILVGFAGASFLRVSSYFILPVKNDSNKDQILSLSAMQSH